MGNPQNRGPLGRRTLRHFPHSGKGEFLERSTVGCETRFAPAPDGRMRGNGAALECSKPSKLSLGRDVIHRWPSSKREGRWSKEGHRQTLPLQTLLLSCFGACFFQRFPAVIDVTLDVALFDGLFVVGDSQFRLAGLQEDVRQPTMPEMSQQLAPCFLS